MRDSHFGLTKLADSGNISHLTSTQLQISSGEMILRKTLPLLKFRVITAIPDTRTQTGYIPGRDLHTLLLDVDTLLNMNKLTSAFIAHVNIYHWISSFVDHAMYSYLIYLGLICSALGRSSGIETS